LSLPELIDRALAEDVGDGDATAAATVPEAARGRATITQKAPGVISGLEVAEAVFRRLDGAVKLERLGPEGEWREAGAGVLRAEGSARALLTAERTALNFLGRLSGVATLTATVVRAIREAGGGAQLLDTRKTTPGLRALEKAAVAHGGGVNHRFGLYDAILIKENHIALAGGVAEAVRRAREARPELPLTVEVRDPSEIAAALEAGAPRLLLDNMSPDEIRAAVAQVGGRAELEASGGIDPDTVLVYATISGLDYVSMGALTHSAPGLDLSLILETLP
jgi:nicotinate-nucleotide pyrophosphorylase (carboxylating)